MSCPGERRLRAGEWLRCKQSERDHQLRDVITEHLEAMDSLWQVVKVPAQRIGERLRFLVVVQACQVPPTAIVADLDQPGPELDTEQHPAQQQDDGELRSSGGPA